MKKKTSDRSRKDFKSMGKNFVVDGPTRGLTDLPTNQPKIIIKNPVAWTKINYSVN